MTSAVKEVTPTGAAALAVSLIALVLVLLQPAERTDASFSGATTATMTTNVNDPGRWQAISFAPGGSMPNPSEGIIRFNDEEILYHQGELLTCDGESITAHSAYSTRYDDSTYPDRNRIRVVGDDGTVYKLSVQNNTPAQYRWTACLQ